MNMTVDSDEYKKTALPLILSLENFLCPEDLENDDYKKKTYTIYMHSNPDK